MVMVMVIAMMVMVMFKLFSGDCRGLKSARISWMHFWSHNLPPHLSLFLNSIYLKNKIHFHIYIISPPDSIYLKKGYYGVDIYYGNIGTHACTQNQHATFNTEKRKYIPHTTKYICIHQIHRARRRCTIWFRGVFVFLCVCVCVCLIVCFPLVLCVVCVLYANNPNNPN